LSQTGDIGHLTGPALCFFHPPCRSLTFEFRPCKEVHPKAETVSIRIAITMGDPAGVGPETIAKAFEYQQRPGAAGFDLANMEPEHSNASLEHSIFVLGNSDVMRRAVDLIGSTLAVTTISEPEDFFALDRSQKRGRIFCLDCVSPEAALVPPATIDARGGHAAYQATAAAAKLAMENRIDAMVTAPLQKESLHLAGHHWPGHTEMLADLCGVKDVAMMLYLPPFDSSDPTVNTLPPRLRLGDIGLGVGHVTLHLGMKDAISQLTQERILETSRLVNCVMEGFSQVIAGGRPISLAVAALNPHAGENGLFGREELDLIEPAIAEGRIAGLPLSSALPCDTLMVRAAAGEFDGVVAMYHDQGHIALKLMGMQRAVNIALGLPIVRTSVAHGTAFDRAWKGTANHDSLLHAIKVAQQLASVKHLLNW